MAMTPTWHNEEKTILEMVFTDGGIKSWDEYHHAMDKAFEMASSVPHNVYMVVNAGTSPMPSGNPLLHIRRVVRLLPYNIPMVISIVDNVFAEMILSILSRLNVIQKLHTCPSWDAAYQHIKEHQEQTKQSV